MTRVRHWWMAVTALPLLVLSPHWRALLVEMRAYCASLPVVFQRPLPEALRAITPERPPVANSQDERRILALADLTALLDRRSPLGLCLRRSALRYYYLRRIGIPVAMQFGARLQSGKPDREITGHAWLTLNGQPYHEADENYRGFTIMITHPH